MSGVGERMSHTLASPSSRSRLVLSLPVDVDAGGEGKPDEAGLLAVAVWGGSGRSGS